MKRINVLEGPYKVARWIKFIGGALQLCVGFSHHRRLLHFLIRNSIFKIFFSIIGCKFHFCITMIVCKNLFISILVCMSFSLLASFVRFSFIIIAGYKNFALLLLSSVIFLIPIITDVYKIFLNNIYKTFILPCSIRWSLYTYLITSML